MTGTEQGAHDPSTRSSYLNRASNYGPTIFKIIELALAILCIGLFHDPAHNSRFRQFVGTHTIALGYVTFGSVIIICGAYIIGKCLRDTIPWKITGLINFVATVLFVACAVTILKDWSDTKERNYWPPNTTRMDLACGAGSVSVIAAFVFLLDTLFILRLGSRGELE